MTEIEQFFGAIQLGKIKEVETLLSHNPDLVNVKDTRGFTPLIFACYFDQKGIAKLLLKHDASVDARDGSGNTALIGVSFKGNLPIAELLIKHGANVNAQNSNGISALMYAAMYNQSKMVSYLLSLKVDTTLKDKDGKIAYELALEKGLDLIASKIKENS